MTTSLIQKPQLDPEFAQQPMSLQAKTPMDLLQLAIEREGSIDVIERLAKLQLEMADREDRIAFRSAMTKFKNEMPRIIRSRVISNKEGNEKYKAVALEDVAEPVMKALLRHHITYRYKTDVLQDGKMVKVTCFLALEGTAYEEQGSTLAAPPDTSGGKDALKAVGSTTSYLEKYTLMASVGLHVFGSDPEAVTPSEALRTMAPDELQDCLDAIKNAPNPAKYEEMFRAAHKAAKDDQQANLEIDVFAIKEAPTPDVEKAIFKIIFAKRRDEGNDHALRMVNDAHNAAKSAFLKGGAL